MLPRARLFLVKPMRQDDWSRVVLAIDPSLPRQPVRHRTRIGDRVGRPVYVHRRAHTAPEVATAKPPAVRGPKRARLEFEQEKSTSKKQANVHKSVHSYTSQPLPPMTRVRGAMCRGRRLRPLRLLARVGASTALWSATAERARRQVRPWPCRLGCSGRRSRRRVSRGHRAWRPRLQTAPLRWTRRSRRPPRRRVPESARSTALGQ
jgi:hypothetical protein